MTVTKLHGVVTITDLKDGQLVKRQYIGYSVKQSIRQFKKYLKGKL